MSLYRKLISLGSGRFIEVSDLEKARAFSSIV